MRETIERDSERDGRKSEREREKVKEKKVREKKRKRNGRYTAFIVVYTYGVIYMLYSQDASINNLPQYESVANISIYVRLVG